MELNNLSDKEIAKRMVDYINRIDKFMNLIREFIRKHNGNIDKGFIKSE